MSTAPFLVTAVSMGFTDENLRSVSVPAGTAVQIYNRHLDRTEKAEELLALALKRNASAGPGEWLVVQILGEPRLVRRTELITMKPQAAPLPKRQTSLF